MENAQRGIPKFKTFAEAFQFLAIEDPDVIYERRLLAYKKVVSRGGTKNEMREALGLRPVAEF